MKTNMDPQTDHSGWQVAKLHMDPQVRTTVTCKQPNHTVTQIHRLRPWQVPNLHMDPLTGPLACNQVAFGSTDWDQVTAFESIDIRCPCHAHHRQAGQCFILVQPAC